MNINKNILSDKRVRIIAGHYGSGKTTFSLNYGLQLAEIGGKVAMSDLDIVNPYFRLREHEKLFEEKNIALLGSLLKADAGDLPAVSSDVLTSIYNKDINAIIDLGGDEAGSRAFATFKEHINESEVDLFMVVNINREQTSNVKDIIFHIENIERTIGIKTTALISNSHLMEYSTADEIIAGYEVCKEVAAIKGIGIRYVAIDKTMMQHAEQIASKVGREKIFEMHYSVRQDYLIGK